MTSSKSVFWVAFAVFVASALAFDRHAELLSLDVALASMKVAIGVAFLGFVAYTAYCSSQEDLFGSVRRIFELHWGRQIGADLYLGLALALFVVYLNEGSFLVTLLWLVPALFFVNLVTLLYFALHFEEIVARFLS